MNLNKALIGGRLTKDPEIKKVGDKSVCEFSVATNEYWKDSNGEKQERVEFHNIVVWGKLGGLCKQYLSKGSEVWLEGTIKTDSYEKDGVKKYITKIISSNVQFLSNKEDSSKGGF